MCTAITTSSLDQHHFFARTMDLPTTTPWRPVYLPADSWWQPSTGDTGQSLPFALLGGGRWTPGNHYLMGDAMNTAGLACAELFFPIEAHYATTPSAHHLNLTPQDFIYWALLHDSIASVAADLPTLRIVAKAWQQEDNWRPFHWLLTDRTGQTAILEPQDETLTLTPAPLHVLTNTPNYPAHVKRLQQRLGHPEATSWSTLLSQIKAFNGNLPHTNLPTDRFQRTAIHLWQQAQPQDATAAVNQLITLLDDVVIARTPDRLTRHNLDYTHYEDVLDLTNLQMTFKSTRTQQIHQVSLNDLQDRFPQQSIALPFT